jgi:tetratricopeptide (TPR) repeat protein
MPSRLFLSCLLFVALVPAYSFGQSASTQPAPSVPADVEAAKIILPIEIPIGYRFDRVETAYHFLPAGPRGDLVVGRDANSTGAPALNNLLRVLYVRSDKPPIFMTPSAPGVSVAFDGQYAWSMGVNGVGNQLEVLDPDSQQSTIANEAQGLPFGVVDRAQIVGWKKGVVFIAAYTQQPHPWTWIAKATYRPGAPPKVKLILSCNNTGSLAGDAMPVNHTFKPSFAVVSVGPPGGGEKAKPCIYIGRSGSDQMIAIDPDTLDCELCKLNVSAIPSTMENLLPTEHVTASAGTFYRDGIAAWDVPHDKSLAPADTSPYAFDGKTFTIKKTGQHFTVSMPEGAAPKGHVFHIASSNVFGLVADDKWQLVPFTGAALDALPQATTNAAWLQQQAEAQPNRSLLEALAYYYHAKGDDDDSAQSLADALKNVNPKDLDGYMEEDRVADELMRWGDYKLAQSVADAAARSGARWAISISGFAAEGLGNWDRAEKLAREAGESYSDPTEWYSYCVRTGHGDNAAAKANCATHLDPASEDSDVLLELAAFKLFSGKNADAEAIYNKVAAGPKHDTWSVLQSALFAQQRGDIKARDKWIMPFADPGRTSGVSLDIMAGIIAKALKYNKPLDEVAVDQCIANSDDCPCTNEDVSLCYMAGMFELIQGQKEEGIAHLRRAAGTNSIRSSRTLATLKLRSMGIDPPRSGQLK